MEKPFVVMGKEEFSLEEPWGPIFLSYYTLLYQIIGSISTIHQYNIQLKRQLPNERWVQCFEGEVHSRKRNASLSLILSLLSYFDVSHALCYLVALQYQSTGVQESVEDGYEYLFNITGVKKIKWFLSLIRCHGWKWLRVRSWNHWIVLTKQ